MKFQDEFNSNLRMFYLHLWQSQRRTQRAKKLKDKKGRLHMNFYHLTTLSYYFRDYSHFSKLSVCLQRPMLQGNQAKLCYLVPALQLKRKKNEGTKPPLFGLWCSINATEYYRHLTHWSVDIRHFSAIKHISKIILLFATIELGLTFQNRPPWK